MDKLIANLAEKFTDLTEDDISLSVETIIAAMSARLISGGRIELRGFGSFSLKNQALSARRNSIAKTNENVVKNTAVIFKPGLVIRESINNAGKYENVSTRFQVKSANNEERVSVKQI